MSVSLCCFPLLVFAHSLVQRGLDVLGVHLQGLHQHLQIHAHTQTHRHTDAESDADAEAEADGGKDADARAQCREDRR
jgi:hypothetical protein